jgi:hypothetical protein
MRVIAALTTCVYLLAAASGASGQSLTPTAPPPLTPTEPPPVAPTAPSSAPSPTPTAPPLAPSAPPPVAPSAPPPAPRGRPAPTQTPGAVTTLSTLTVGNWSGGAYSAPGSRDFDHCAAETLYDSGITLGFTVTNTFQWGMYFYNPAWKLTTGTSYPLAFTIDYSPPDTATAIAYAYDAVDVPLTPDMTLFNRFIAGERLKVEAAHENFVFNLTDTSKLLPDLLNCVHSYVGATPDPSNPF